MILKERKIPLLILKTEALLRRLPAHHPKIPIINEELNKRLAGYKGEASLDFPLDFLDSKEYIILHDLRLPDSDRFFQIDTLILTKKFALILEVKNITGILHFDTVYNQLIRIKNGKEQVFPCPLIQVNRQASQLRRWFNANVSKEAHMKALHDYSLLLGAVITNRELRNFLHISSSYTATRLLQSLNLPETGAYKNKTYTLILPEETTVIKRGI